MYYNLAQANLDEDVHHPLTPFEGLDVPGYDTGGYPFYFDVGVTQARIGQLLELLHQGPFVDERTRILKMRLLTWNSEINCLTSSHLEFQREIGRGYFRLYNYSVTYNLLDLDGAEQMKLWVWYAVWLLLMFVLFIWEHLVQIWTFYDAEMALHCHESLALRMAAWKVALTQFCASKFRCVIAIWTGHTLCTGAMAFYCDWKKNHIRMRLDFDILDNLYNTANFLLVKRVAAGSGGSTGSQLLEAAAKDLAGAAAEYDVLQPELVEDLRWPLPQDLTGVEGYGRLIEEVNAIEASHQVLSWMGASSGMVLALIIVYETGYLPRFRSVMSTFKKCGADLIHFFGIIFVLVSALGVLIHLQYGAHIEALSDVPRSTSSLATNFIGTTDATTVKQLKRITNMSDSVLLMIISHIVIFLIPGLTAILLMNMLLGMIGEAAVGSIKKRNQNLRYEKFELTWIFSLLF
eukprot:gene2189-2898_t